MPKHKPKVNILTITHENGAFIMRNSDEVEVARGDSGKKLGKLAWGELGADEVEYRYDLGLDKEVYYR